MQALIQTANGEYKSPVQQIEIVQEPFIADSNKTWRKKINRAAGRSRLNAIRKTFSLEPHTFNEFPVWKRGLDIFGSLIGILLMAPFMAVIAMTIKLTSRGSVIYKQARIGHRGEAILYV